MPSLKSPRIADTPGEIFFYTEAQEAAMRILIADSHVHVRAALRLLFEQQGEFVVCGAVADSENLLAQVCTTLPDLILLDWNLPGLQPYYLLQALKRYRPAILLLATSVNPENARNALASGVDGFILKSLPPDEFLQATCEAVKKHKEEH
jgi:DNA-binding NarL/FixJ family response regulator